MRGSNFPYFSKPEKPDYNYPNLTKTRRLKTRTRSEPEKQYPNPTRTRLLLPEPITTQRAQIIYLFDGISLVKTELGFWCLN